ncbi:aldehyde dehydrogenase family protein [Sulfolobus sp. E5-1-F]|uniref:2,5-dioxopentanoate dehydrogenase n=1 Tax=Sulfolobaceae TaxID=118883 RepID=UPI001297F6C6|nr:MULTISPECIES: 2,5-dioxopentanoate dehydrogenase [unclassified Sulfolobus]QGA55268.1 aldehyde dehydrogenase family protein [Sulfolobus sp. E5-1-F]QGA68056.1 aldehyde dehydrogenase family protein [Sulfolobus sp. E11-6]
MKSYQELADKWIKGSGEEYLDINPADKDHVLAKIRTYTKDDVKEAINKAVAKFDEWSKTPAPKRGAILLKAGELMEQEAQEFALLMTLEEGKTLKDSMFEVVRSYNLLKFYGALAFKISGKTLPSADPNTRIFTVKEPLGVVALITPWNFPLSIPVWKLAPALAAGNTAIIKPASKTPLMVAKLIDVLSKAGLPEGVVNLVVGKGSEVGDTIVSDENIAAVSFTGSTEVGKRIYKLVGNKNRMTRIQLELGGKNALYVDKSADLALAAELAVRGGFGLTGQSCTATSRLIVHKDVYGQFKQRLIERVKRWRVGPGTEDVDMGPVVDESQFKKDLEYIEYGKNAGAKLVYGGNTIPGKGYFLEPTIFEGVTPDMRLFKEEIFGPVLSVTEAKDLDEAIRLVNAVDYGHTAGIVASDIKAINEFISRVEAGVIKVNKPTVGLELQAPFGGFKNSGATTWKEMGEEALEFYLKEKTVYEGW